VNWSAIGAIGELVGALAVVVTLVYLAAQIKHARADSRKALSQGRVEGMRELFALATDERINRVATKTTEALGARQPPFGSALIEQVGLTKEEAFLLFNFHLAWWNTVVQIIPNVDELPETERRQFDGGILGRYAQNTAGALFFETMKPGAHPDVVAYVEGILEQSR